MCENCPPEVIRWVADVCCGPITSDYIDNHEGSERLKWHPKEPPYAGGSESDGDKIKLWTLTRPYGWREKRSETAVATMPPTTTLI